MGKLIYSALVSADGFIETSDRGIDWIPIDQEIHAFFNDMARSVSLSLYGRRLYQVMRAWHTWDTNPDARPYEVEFARIWQATPKLVFSRTLDEVGPNCTLVREVIPEEIARLARESDKNLEVGGADLAATFVRLGLVDEIRPVVCPILLGAGTPFWPPHDKPLPLTLLDQRTFSSGVTYLRYEVKR